MWREVSLSDVAGARSPAAPHNRKAPMADLTLVWFHPRHADRAKEVADGIRGAKLRNAKYWQMEPCARAVVDPDAPEIVMAYREAGITAETWDGDVVAEPEPEGAKLPAGYEVVQSGSWYKLIGPDGEQVGNAKRSEDEAAAQMGD